jgi:hypothetical protein
MGAVWTAVVSFVQANWGLITGLAVFVSGAVYFVHLLFQIRKAHLEIRKLRAERRQSGVEAIIEALEPEARPMVSGLIRTKGWARRAPAAKTAEENGQFLENPFLETPPAEPATVGGIFIPTAAQVRALTKEPDPEEVRLTIRGGLNVGRTAFIRDYTGADLPPKVRSNLRRLSTARTRGAAALLLSGAVVVLMALWRSSWLIGIELLAGAVVLLGIILADVIAARRARQQMDVDKG